MKRLLILMVAGLLLGGCNKTNATAEKAVPKPVAAAPAPIPMPEPELRQPDHFYSMREGYLYGYERKLSVNEANNGQASTTVLMFQYAGEKDGKHQVLSEEKNVFTVFECAGECEFIKVMLCVGGELYKVERIRAANTVVAAVLLDAKNGKLEQVVREKRSHPNKKFHIWFNERAGFQMTEIKG